jgi:hypothetical protein
VTPALRRPNAVTLARTGTVLGDRIVHEPAGHCDQCGCRLSVYANHARCYTCEQIHGPDHTLVISTLREPWKTSGHTQDCECFERRYPMVDEYGKLCLKVDGSQKYLIRVTCPHCNAPRVVRFGGQHTGRPLCQARFTAACASCACAMRTGITR